MDVALPKTLAELMAAARAMEHEAAVRYEALAEDMARHGNRELAALFADLGAEEREHEARMGRLIRGDDARPPAPLRWRPPEATDREAEEEAGGVWLMTPHSALCLAVENEERAFAFFSRVAAVLEDRPLREMAEALAKEELEHVVRLRLERRRAWRAESRSVAAEAAAAHSLAALLRRALAIEREAARLYDALGQAAAHAGEPAIAAFFRELAAEQRSRLAGIGRRAEAAGVHAPPMEEAPPGPVPAVPRDALHLALAGTEKGVRFYEAVAERGVDQDMMEEAQRLALHALGRLKRIRERMEPAGAASRPA